MIGKWSVGYETEWQKENRLEVSLQECWGNKGTKNRPETSSRIDNVKTYQLHLRLPFSASLSIVRLTWTANWKLCMK